MVEFRDIDGFPGYHICVDGRVWSNKMGGRWLRLIADKDGYLRCALCNDGKPVTKRVHRLVLEAFIGPCPDGMECRHLDGNPQNNHVSNLRWGTPSNNQHDRIDHGTYQYGLRNPCGKLSVKDVKEIHILLSDGYTQQKNSRFIWCLKAAHICY